METTEEVIQDKKLLGNIIKSLFVNLPISMIYKNEELPIRMVCIEQDFVLIRSTGREDKDERILTFTNNGSLYHFYFEYTDKSTPDLEYLEPIRLVVRKHQLRKQQRTTFSQKDTSYITNFILDSRFIGSLSENILWTKALNETLASLRSKYKYVEFQFYDELNLRFRVLNYTGLPIFFPRNDWFPANSSFTDLKPIRNILGNENWNELKGPEITIPAYYKSKRIIGALIIKNDKELEMGDYTLVNMLFSLLQRELNQTQKLTFCTDRCKIKDISLGGIGFLIEKEEIFSRFAVGQEMISEISLGGASALLSLIIRNVNLLEGKGLRVGAEFKNLGEEERIFIKNFYHHV